jgi:dehydrodolichyl diphosphate syntase complex subunit NUS1
MVATLFLWLLHILHASLVYLIAKFQKRRYLPPQPITAYRSKLPKHLAIILVSYDAANPKNTEELYLECLVRVVKWCRVLGIEQLTAYDAEGTLLGCSDIIQERLIHCDDLSTDESESELEYPLTPPLSEASESRSHSPDFEDFPLRLNVKTVYSFRKSASHRRPRKVAVRRRAHDKDPPHNPLTLHIIARSASKAAIASAARFLFDEEFHRRQNSHNLDHVKAYELPISKLNSILEGGLPSPDFMIVHHVCTQDPPPPLELHGFPPWQIALTEIHRTIAHDVVPLNHSNHSVSSLITEEAFCRALDEYAGAQFRLGR